MKNSFRFKLLPTTVKKMLIFIGIMILIFVVGMLIGYSGLGHGKFFQVFKFETWSNIFSYLKVAPE